MFECPYSQPPELQCRHLLFLVLAMVILVHIASEAVRISNFLLRRLKLLADVHWSCTRVEHMEHQVHVHDLTQVVNLGCKSSHIYLCLAQSPRLNRMYCSEQPSMQQSLTKQRLPQLWYSIHTCCNQHRACYMLFM